jgi:hypothetical protein
MLLEARDVQRAALNSGTLSRIFQTARRRRVAQSSGTDVRFGLDLRPVWGKRGTSLSGERHFDGPRAAVRAQGVSLPVVPCAAFRGARVTRRGSRHERRSRAEADVMGLRLLVLGLLLGGALNGCGGKQGSSPDVPHHEIEKKADTKIPDGGTSSP